MFQRRCENVKIKRYVVFTGKLIAYWVFVISYVGLLHLKLPTLKREGCYKQLKCVSGTMEQ